MDNICPEPPKKKRMTLAQQVMNQSKSKLTPEEERDLHKQKLANEMKTVQFRKVDLI